MTDHWKKIIAEKAQDVMGGDKLSKPSAALLDAEISPVAYMRAMENAGRWIDATKFLAYALPRREAVWWACMCVTDGQAIQKEMPGASALAAAEKWVFEPTDDHRTAAFVEVQKSHGSSGGKMCALAAAFSEEKLPLGGGQHLDVDPTAFPDLIFAAVFNVAKESDNGTLNENLEACLAIGEDIARGGNGKKPDPAAEVGSTARQNA